MIVSWSGVNKTDMEQMFLGYAPSPQTAIDRSLNRKGPGSSMIVLPYAVDILPGLLR